MTTTKTFTLQVDNAQDLYNSTLFWKYNGDANHNISEIFSNSFDKVEFQIKAKPSKIEYWYQNSQQEEEKVRRIYNLRQNQEIQVDKFNCHNLVLKCVINQQDYLNNAQMFYITEERNQYIGFNNNNLIYLPFGKQATFLLYYQGAEQVYTMVKFKITLVQQNYIGNSLPLTIDKDDLKKCLTFNQVPFQFKNENIEFEIIERNRNEDCILYILRNQFQVIERQSNNMDNFIKKTEQWDNKLQNLSQFTKQNNFFSEEKQSTQNAIMPATTFSQSIILEQKKPGLEQNLFKTQEKQKLGKQLQQFQNNTIQRQKKIELDKQIKQKKDNQQETDQQDDSQSQQAIDLQPNNYYNNSQQYDESSQQAIQEQNEMIKELKEKYIQQIEELKLQIKQLGFELRCEKEKIEDIKRIYNLKIIQNFRERKFIPFFGENKNPKHVKSTNNLILPSIPKLQQKNVDQNQFKNQNFGQTRYLRTQTNSKLYTQGQ